MTIVGLLDPAKDDCESLGIVGIARQGDQDIELSLDDLDVDQNDPNHQLIEDYWYWFWNWQ